mgnify:FL=1
MIINNTKNIYPRTQDKNVRIKICMEDNIDNIEFVYKDVYIKQSSELKLQIDVIPHESSNEYLVWKSSDISIATVNNGYVKLLNPGEVKITVSNISEKTSDFCNIHVISKETINTINLLKRSNPKEGSLYITNGYMEENDGGEASYIIMSYDKWYEKLSVDLKAIAYRNDGLGNPIWSKTVVDECGNHTLDNNLVAVLIKGEINTPEQWGCVGDGITDNTEQLLHMFAHTKSGYIKFKENAKYLMKSRPKNRMGYSNNEYIWLMCGGFIAGSAHGKPVMANVDGVVLDGNGCTIEIAENDYCVGTNDFGIFEFGGFINNLEIKNFNFNGNGLTQLYYVNSDNKKVNIRTTNHTIFYNPSNMNAVQLSNGRGEIKPEIPYKDKEIVFSNIKIHNNNFYNSGTCVNTSDGGGDFILLINPTSSENVFIEDNYFENWGRWVFSVDLGGSGERFYNYKFNRNICIQNDRNKLNSGAYRGLGWIDFEARKCWTGLEVCNNTVQGLTGWAFNGNGKVSNNINVSNNKLVRNDERSYKSAYPYAFEWYSVYTKDLIFENNIIENGTIKLGLTIDSVKIIENKINGTSIGIHGLYGNILINGNICNQAQLVQIKSLNLPFYITDTTNENYVKPKERNCNFIFTNNTGGIEGGQGNSAKIFDPNDVGKYSYIKLTVKDNIMKKFNIIAWNIENFEFDPSQMVSGTVFSARGAKFTSPSYSLSVNNPVVGGGMWGSSEVVSKNINVITRMEGSPYYSKLKISEGNTFKTSTSGYLPMNGLFLMADSDLSYYNGRSVNKYDHVYTDTDLYIACSSGKLGEVLNHKGGKVVCGEVEMLYLAPLAKVEIVSV